MTERTKSGINLVSLLFAILMAVVSILSLLRSADTRWIEEKFTSQESAIAAVRAEAARIDAVRKDDVQDLKQELRAINQKLDRMAEGGR